MKTISHDRKKLLGCFLGKNIGGTLGMPYEGRKERLTLKYYDPVPTAPSANDDLDLQIVWLQHVQERGLALDSQCLAQAWLDHIDCHFDEYGVALWNLKRGLKPPLTGIHNNFFQNGMGAAIRSEIWASLFPGQPLTAAHYAYQDAAVDHWGEGIHAELFLAAFQSLLYVNCPVRKALAAALRILPSASKIRQAARTVLRTFDQGRSYVAVRDLAAERYGNVNFTDCVMNLAYILIALLWGRDDFERSILLAVNCGQDTDCTAATVGASLGILHGVDRIPEKWRRPVGWKIVTSEYLKRVRVPADIPSLATAIEELRASFGKQRRPVLSCPFDLPNVAAVSDRRPWRIGGRKVQAEGIRVPVGDHVQPNCKSVILETAVRSGATQTAQMLICSPGMFRVWLDSRFLGTWGAQHAIVPAFQRVEGGRVFNVDLIRNRRRHLKIELLPTVPVPEVVVAFADEQMRHLTNVSQVA